MQLAKVTAHTVLARRKDGLRSDEVQGEWLTYCLKDIDKSLSEDLHILMERLKVYTADRRFYRG